MGEINHEVLMQNGQNGICGFHNRRIFQKKFAFLITVGISDFAKVSKAKSILYPNSLSLNCFSLPLFNTAPLSGLL